MHVNPSGSTGDVGLWCRSKTGIFQPIADGGSCGALTGLKTACTGTAGGTINCYGKAWCDQIPATSATVQSAQLSKVDLKSTTAKVCTKDNLFTTDCFSSKTASGETTYTKITFTEANAQYVAVRASECKIYTGTDAAPQDVPSGVDVSHLCPSAENAALVKTKSCTLQNKPCGDGGGGEPDTDSAQPMVTAMIGIVIMAIMAVVWV